MFIRGLNTPLTSCCYSMISRRFLAVTPRPPTLTTKAPHSALLSGDLKPTVSNPRTLNFAGAQVSSLSTQSAFNFKPRKQNAEMEAVEAVLTGRYPAKAHARRVVEYIRKKKPDATGVLYLEGQKTRMIEDNDETMPFRYVPTPLPSYPTDSLFKTATILLLHDRLCLARRLLHIRYRNRQKHTLYPAHRPRICNLVRTTPLRRGSPFPV